MRLQNKNKKINEKNSFNLFINRSSYVNNDGFIHSITEFYQSSIPEEAVNLAEDSTEYEFETAIYYGDSKISLGDPFTITCIIPITDPIFWIKDGEPIVRHNLRHGRDEHSYVLSETPIEGEYNKQCRGKLQMTNRVTWMWMWMRDEGGAVLAIVEMPFMPYFVSTIWL